MKTKITKLTAITLLLCLCFAFVSCELFTGTEKDDHKATSNGDQSSNTVDNKNATSFVAVDINPSIELTLDEEDQVVSVYGANDDGKVLLYEENTNIVGKDVDEAVAYITDLAIELGYLSADNSQVNTYVSSNDEEKAAELKSKIDSKIVSVADGMELAVTVTPETAFDILCKLDELKSLYPESAAIQNLTPQKYRLAVSASSDGEIAIEAAAAMSDEDLIAEIKNAHKVLGSYATEAYLEAKARAKLIFESSMGIINDAVYTQIYTERAASIMTNLSYINTIHYGAMYQAYKTSARTYNSVFEIMKFANEYTDFVVGDEVVASISAELGIEDTTPLMDENGEITLGSVTNFCNKFIDENDVSDSVKSEIKEILAEAKDAAELVTMASDTFSSDLQTLKTAIQNVITTVSNISSTILPLLPAAAKAEFEACLDDLSATSERLTKIMEEGDTSDAVLALATEAEKKADEILDKIRSDLTDEEKARAESIISRNENQINSLTQSFLGRLEDAEKNAAEYLASKRSERVTKSEN